MSWAGHSCIPGRGLTHSICKKKRCSGSSSHSKCTALPAAAGELKFVNGQSSFLNNFLTDPSRDSARLTWIRISASSPDQVSHKKPFCRRPLPVSCHHSDTHRPDSPDGLHSCVPTNPAQCSAASVTEQFPEQLFPHTRTQNNSQHKQDNFGVSLASHSGVQL